MGPYIYKNIKGEVYEKFINYACEKCDAVMFITRTDGFNKEQIEELETTMKEVEEKLSQSFIKKEHKPTWVFHEVLIEREEDKKNYSVYFYKTTPEVKEYLLSNKDLFSWLNPKWPEDISFFKNGYCWFNSVTHEEYCALFYEGKEEYEYLKSIGIELAYLEDGEYYETQEEELYYEDYMNN